MKRIIIAIIILLAITSNALAVQYQPATYKLLSTTNINATTCEIAVPSGYTKLKLVGTLNRSNVSYTMGMNFNADYATGNYAYNNLMISSSIAYKISSSYNNIIFVDNSINSAKFYISLNISNKTSEYKFLDGSMVTETDTQIKNGGCWKSNAEINKISLFAYTPSVLTGVVELWGQP